MALNALSIAESVPYLYSSYLDYKRLGYSVGQEFAVRFENGTVWRGSILDVKYPATSAMALKVLFHDSDEPYFVKVFDRRVNNKGRAEEHIERWDHKREAKLWNYLYSHGDERINARDKTTCEECELQIRVEEHFENERAVYETPGLKNIVAGYHGWGKFLSNTPSNYNPSKLEKRWAQPNCIILEYLKGIRYGLYMEREKHQGLKDLAADYAGKAASRLMANGVLTYYTPDDMEINMMILSDGPKHAGPVRIFDFKHAIFQDSFEPHLWRDLCVEHNLAKLQLHKCKKLPSTLVSDFRAQKRHNEYMSLIDAARELATEWCDTLDVFS